MANVAIIGAGVMGLAAAYHAAGAGHAVRVFEADTVPGGMAAHTDLDGLSIERFYHFICKPDAPTFRLMDELGIGDRMRWVDTKMGYFIDGKHYKWGDPFSLLRFPLMSLADKIRYGLTAFRQTKKKNFDDLEHLTVREWVVRDFGQKTYDLMWRRLMELKFFEYTDKVSAPWVAVRIKRIGNSRKSIFQEQLGHIEGGSEALVEALVSEIGRMGGEIRLGDPALEVTAADGAVTGVRSKAGDFAADHVISTAPTPFVSRLIPALTDAEKAAYDAIENIGCVCVVLKLARPVSPNFWTNISDARIEIPALVEFSNLRDTGAHVVYAPFYMPVTNAKFARDDAAFIDESMAYIRMLNPDIGPGDLLAANVARLKHAQPVCPPGFADTIPPIRTSIRNLQVADTCYYYPEDRGVSESARLAREMAAAIGDTA